MMELDDDYFAGEDFDPDDTRLSIGFRDGEGKALFWFRITGDRRFMVGDDSENPESDITNDILKALGTSRSSPV